MSDRDPVLTRRRWLAAVTSVAAASCASDPEETRDETTSPLPTPPRLAGTSQEPEPLSFEACDAERMQSAPTTSCALTHDGGDGPYYTPGAPEKDTLIEAGMQGSLLIVTGRVLDESCQPLPGAWLDVWHADRFGDYDNEGFSLRGMVRADDQGSYRLETIMPGYYGGRPAHIHVKIRPSGLAELTTQVYFAGDERITAPIAASGLVMPVCRRADDVIRAYFDFVVPPQLTHD